MSSFFPKKSPLFPKKCPLFPKNVLFFLKNVLFFLKISPLFPKNMSSFSLKMSSANKNVQCESSRTFSFVFCKLFREILHFLSQDTQISELHGYLSINFCFEDGNWQNSDLFLFPMKI